MAAIVPPFRSRTRKPLNTLRGIETFGVVAELPDGEAPRKPLNTLRGIETIPVARTEPGWSHLENPSTPSGVLKPICRAAQRSMSRGASLENPSTPSGVLKPRLPTPVRRAHRLENPSTPSGVLKLRTAIRPENFRSPGGSKTPQHPPGY